MPSLIAACSLGGSLCDTAACCAFPSSLVNRDSSCCMCPSGGLWLGYLAAELTQDGTMLDSCLLKVMFQKASFVC